MLDYQIRKATTGDAAQIAALAIQVWLDTYTKGINALCAEYVLHEFTAAKMMVQIAQHQCWVAENQQSLLGFAVIESDANHAEHGVELLKLYVQPQWQHQGIGRALLAQVQAATPRFFLAVNHENESAIAFYRGLGLQDIGVRDFVLGEQKHQNLLFSWQSNLIVV